MTFQARNGTAIYIYMYRGTLHHINIQEEPSILPRNPLTMSKHDRTNLEDDETEPDRDLLGEWERDRSRSLRNSLRRLEVHHWVGLFFIAIGIVGVGIALIVIPST